MDISKYVTHDPTQEQLDAYFEPLTEARELLEQATAKVLAWSDDGSGTFQWLKGEVRDIESAWLIANPPALRRPGKAKKAPIPSDLRRAVFERDAYRCQQCGDWHNLTVDHIHPESKGGTLELTNLQTLCDTCNKRKGARV